jgi:hypothetical protein
MEIGDLNVFLSGPMTGRPDMNRAAFARARKACAGSGARFVFDPSIYWGHDELPRWWYVREDLHVLTMSTDGHPFFDVVVLLDGWWESDGACVEADVATACGIPLIVFRCGDTPTFRYGEEPQLPPFC